MLAVIAMLLGAVVGALLLLHPTLAAPLILAAAILALVHGGAQREFRQSQNAET